jgi:dipeptidyl aminopeptidase/acylaminoacyl peptidase
LLIAAAGTVLGISYQHTKSYLHPERHTASGELLRMNGIKYQEVELLTEDNVKLSAWYTPPQNGVVILVAHGYGDKRPEDFYLLFACHGYGVLAWDFRAHGESGGDFSTLGYYEALDAKAALDFALAQPGVEHVGAWGGYGCEGCLQVRGAHGCAGRGVTSRGNEPLTPRRPTS